MESVEKIAEVVLYEGYLLYPYRRSAIKNQQRWTFGGVYPRAYSEANRDDPWAMQTQCLIECDVENPAGGGAMLEIKVRFLHVADRQVMELAGDEGTPRTVPELRVGEQVYRPWEEAIEREIVIGGPQDIPPLRLGDLIGRGRRIAIDVPAGHEDEPLRDATGRVMGLLVREWRALQGAVEIESELVGSDSRQLYRLTVRVVNLTPRMEPYGEGEAWTRAEALRQTFVSTHTILRVRGGAFVSLLEPPAEYQEAARACENIKTWPVLVGAQGERDTLLSSPIILYDYPQIAPESPGDLFDATEIDELLTLSIMTLTDEEKREIHESDARGREILERTEALSTDQLMKLHGAIRSLQPVRRGDQ